MKLAVFGPSYFKGGSYSNYDYLSQVLDTVCTLLNVEEIHTGGGKGVESMALRYGALNSIECHVTPPNINKDGDNAFVIRNNELIEKTDQSLILWDTNDAKYVKTIKQCMQQGRPVLIYPVE